MPEGERYFYADGAYDSKKVLNTIVNKGYLPQVKPGKTGQGNGRRIRKIFDKNEYKRRGICEGFFGDLKTLWR